MHVRKGDKVIVIAGKERNKVGVVERVLPAKNRAIIAGLNIFKKTVKRSAKNPQGGIIDISHGIHISNLMLLDPKTDKPTRTGVKINGTDRTRISKVSGDVIPVKTK